MMPLKNGNPSLAGEGGAETTEHLQHTRTLLALARGPLIMVLPTVSKRGRAWV